MKRDESVKMIERELLCWPGVRAKLEPGTKHNRLTLLYGEASRLVILSATASDHRATLNMIGDVKRSCRAMGAVRG